MKKKLYMIGNAHLDPVWQWRWQEGVTTVRQTIRAALDRMEEDDEFVFTSSQAVMYRWLSECAPDMIGEIRRRVAEGRFVICGGQWVQPDCNTPSGESFARQSLYAQRLFRELLGTTARTAYNVDSFGHAASLPQIFKKCGMDAYVMMRPMEHEKSMAHSVFLWRGPDGTELPTFRIPFAYTKNYKNLADTLADMERTSAAGEDALDGTMVFYGVGNHGGGPTKQNIALVKEARAALGDSCEVVFSDPNRFFDDVRAAGVPLAVVEDELQHHASGCYSAVSEIKRLNRRCEAELYAAEVYAAAAAVRLGLPYPHDALTQAWEDVLFHQFHDSLGGCSIASVYEDAFCFLGGARAAAARAADTATQALSWAVDTENLPGTPVVLFNPHPWPSRVPVQLNGQYDALLDPAGRPVPIQRVVSETRACMRRDDTLFLAELPPLGYTTYRIPAQTPPETAGAPSPVRAGAPASPRGANVADGGLLENEYLTVRFAPHTGYIVSLRDRETGEELLAAPAAVPVVIDEYAHDTWSHGKNFFSEELGRFADAAISVAEEGPVRATMKIVSRCGASTLTQYVSLCAGERAVRVRAELDWHERHKMLKLSFPCDVGENPAAIYEIPFAHFTRPADGEEENGHRYLVLRGDARAMALLNDSRYSFSVRENDVRMTVVRSPIYGDHGGPRGEEARFTDQGTTAFAYTLLPCGASPDYGGIERRAAELNGPPTAIVDNNHRGTRPLTETFLSVSASNVDVSAFKRAEDGGGWILRAWETAGHAVEATVEIPLLDRTLTLSFGRFAVRTLFLPDDVSLPAREVLMTEWAGGSAAGQTRA